MPGQKRTAADDDAEAAGQSAVAAVNIELLLNLSQGAVWMLQKKLLREYFLTLQSHIRALTASSVTESLAVTSSQPPPPQPETQQHDIHVPSSRLLSLPPEIRRQILLHLLSRPTSSPFRGPHPRSLQSPLSLTRTMSPAVLRICQQLYVEGCAVLYSTQEIHVRIDFDVWSHRRERSDLIVSSTVRDAVRYLHVHVFLGNEKRNARLGRKDSEARLEVVRKGVRKLGKWLLGPGVGGKEEKGGRGLQCLRISWQEPPQTYTWEQKKSVLDDFRTLRPIRVEAGEINWGLKYPGRKFRFVEEYLGELGQERGGSQREEQGPVSSTSYDMDIDVI
ncbi:hypothetical protein GE09DRAFT_467315 [Coniochaeta sp. 2T2.1]|nr:hypothetical protein GE09DRAFT_467315 [Coniochaeta sp. 2T2.1]